MQQQIFQRVLELLGSAGLLEGVTEQQMREASTDGALCAAVGRLLYREGEGWPRRLVFYDAEYLYEDNDLMRLVNEFAAATDGEWTPRDIRAEWDGVQARISFDMREQRIDWSFRQQSDWIDCEFYERLDAFAQQHLSGAFVNLPTRDQCACHLYLPREIAAEVAFLVGLNEEPGLDAALLMDIFADAQRLDWLVEVSFARQVCGANFVSLLEVWLPGRVARCPLVSEYSLRISSDGTCAYTRAISDLARLTAGEWEPRQVRCARDEANGGISLEFDAGSERSSWRLTAPAERAVADFSAYLTMFARDVLDGDFVEVGRKHDDVVYLYLPRLRRE